MGITSNARTSALAFLFVFVAACTPVQSTTTSSADKDPSGDTGSPADPGASEQLPAGEALPTDLQGTWLDRWSTSMQYALSPNVYNFDTHVWFEGLNDMWDMAPNRGFGVAFGDDGSFLWVRGEDAGVGGCKSWTIRVSKGTASVVGGSIRFHPTAQQERYHSTCNPDLNYDRSLSNEDFDLPYSIEATQDTGSPVLQLVEESSNTTFVFFKN